MLESNFEAQISLVSRTNSAILGYFVESMAFCRNCGMIGRVVEENLEYSKKRRRCQRRRVAREGKVSEGRKRERRVRIYREQSESQIDGIFRKMSCSSTSGREARNYMKPEQCN